jgi:phosphomannomutase / phosphoglucomutase
MQLNPEMFREYDIRGLVEKELDREKMVLLGKAFGTMVRRKQRKSVAVGCDNRASSEEFKQGFIEGLKDSGCEVTDIGLSTSPLLYYAVVKGNFDAGANITASHNPKEFNGLKLTWENAKPFFGEEIMQLHSLAEKGDFEKGIGKACEKSFLQDYKKMLLEKISLSKKLKVVVDCGNGTAGIVASEILKKWGCEVIELYCELDSNFPNHLPDPVKEKYMKDLIARVREEKADLGIGIDGDGDRIGIVDEQGKMIFGDKLMVLFAREVLEKNPGSKILFEVKCSQALYDEIVRLGGKPIIWKTGHSLIKSKMREENALLAGEMSGHIFFRDEFFGFDDAMYAAGRLLRILSGREKKIGELLEGLPEYYSTPEIRVECRDSEKAGVVEKAKEHFLKKHPDSITVDGIRIIFEDGWALVRQSNTQPKIILRFEAKSKQGLEQIKKEVVEKLLEFKSLDKKELEEIIS